MATVAGTATDPSTNTNIDPGTEADNLDTATTVLGIDSTTQQNLTSQDVAPGTSSVPLGSTSGSGFIVNLTGGAGQTVNVGIEEGSDTTNFLFTGDSNVVSDLPSGGAFGTVKAVLANGGDTVVGGPADHQIFGGLGDDSIGGDVGDDLLFGNQGNDFLRSTVGEDTMYGGQGNDQITGGQDDDVLFGNRGDDLIFGNDGADLIYGGQGDDMVSGGEHGDTIWGGIGDDEVSGIQGADFVDGGAGTDTVHGGAGNDTLKGGSGDDLLFGAEQDDLFLFNGLFGDDTIADFVEGEDTVRLDVNDPNNEFDFPISSLDDIAGLISTDADGNAVLNLGEQSITLQGVSAEDVTSNPGAYFSLFGVSRPMKE